MSSLHKLTVLGAGVLGGQIAWHSAFKGKTVVVYDITADALDRCRATHEQYAEIYLSEVGANEVEIAATRQRLSFTTDLAEAVGEADLVIEAVPEVPDIKADVYRKMSGILPAHTLVATNSSTLLPSDFAPDTGRPEQFCALHFGNGIWAMNFAEVMAHSGTARETLTQVTEFAIEIGMVPIPVLKEQNGYVVNSWFVPLLNAAQTLVTNGIARPEDVDRTFMIGGRTIGPLGLMDMVGMKTSYDVLAHWGNELGDAQMTANAAYIKERFLDKGLYGVPTNEGYYVYPDPAYARPGFLDLPDISVVPHLVSLLSPR
ncbi:3-hydroxyacyl-CoA dehydrogenase [Nocardioides carbamazepini]|uniref:3-hydroxyacyl-CoA dehydrogenase n=1 Tax=Nocardioides carbamazepini TaxID=2854259 RepID=UPI00214A52ED|nr:3-hydroxyacyl-CoA dehydrogenase [Nocardioides carbamazepini]MCR1783778.1 3-hydroxyacyl-CoA dehydrogenase [Nocardioides carbamazepini]